MSKGFSIFKLTVRSYAEEMCGYDKIAELAVKVCGNILKGTDCYYRLMPNFKKMLDEPINENEQILICNKEKSLIQKIENFCAMHAQNPYERARKQVKGIYINKIKSLDKETLESLIISYIKTYADKISPIIKETVKYNNKKCPTLSF